MSAFDLVIMLGGVCGAAMVGAGLVLLFRGTISLKKEPGPSGVSDGVKFEFQGFKLSTDSPTVAFFAIGLLLMAGSAWLSQPADAAPLEIKGQLRAADPSSVKVYVTPGEWPVSRETDGAISGTVYPNLHNLMFVVAAPGHRVPEYRKGIHTKDGGLFGPSRIADLGVIDVGEIVQAKPPADPSRIEPTKEPLPATSQPGRF